MISRGKQATFIKDKNGYLPAHIAASRHVSPNKLRMLLAANPDCIIARTDDGMTLLSLAQSTATASHPNYRLIGTLREALQQAGCTGAALDAASVIPARVSSGDASSDSSKSNEEPKVAKQKQKQKRKPKKAAGKRSTKHIKIKQEVLENHGTNNLDTPGAADLLLHFATANPQNNPGDIESHATHSQFEGAVFEV